MDHSKVNGKRCEMTVIACVRRTIDVEYEIEIPDDVAKDEINGYVVENYWDGEEVNREFVPCEETCVGWYEI
jgi:hypothetical protein